MNDKDPQVESLLNETFAQTQEEKFQKVLSGLGTTATGVGIGIADASEKNGSPQTDKSSYGVKNAYVAADLVAQARDKGLEVKIETGPSGKKQVIVE